MWTNPLTIALVAAGSSLLTIFLTPWLQQHFWTRQRRAEIRLAAINDFNRLTAAFLTGYIAAGANYTPTNEWFTEFMAVSATIQVLFPAAAFAAFMAVQVLIGPGAHGLGPGGHQTVDDFVQARNAALVALYGEVIPV
jgi:hypothetical protein